MMPCASNLISFCVFPAVGLSCVLCEAWDSYLADELAAHSPSIWALNHTNARDTTKSCWAQSPSLLFALRKSKTAALGHTTNKLSCLLVSVVPSTALSRRRYLNNDSVTMKCCTHVHGYPEAESHWQVGASDFSFSATIRLISVVWHIWTTIRWITMKFATDSHVPLRMNRPFS